MSKGYSMKRRSLFVTGWRPFTGWACVTILLFNYIGVYALQYAAALNGWPAAPEPAGMGDMLPVLIGMLGLGGMRTYEKAAGVASDNLDGE